MVLFPSCPLSLRPQHLTVSFVVSAQACVVTGPVPIDIFLTGPRPATSIGVNLEPDVEDAPKIPDLSSLDPQHLTSCWSSTIQIELEPDEICWANKTLFCVEGELSLAGGCPELVESLVFVPLLEFDGAEALDPACNFEEQF